MAASSAPGECDSFAIALGRPTGMHVGLVVAASLRRSLPQRALGGL